jgi:serine/threonine protein kinase
MIRDLGDYEVHEEIGSGTQATVYLARHKALDVPTVLKVLKDDFAEDRSFVERFEREARTMARIPHANIVRVTDYKEVQGLYYIAMEYVEGTDLRVWMKKHGSPPAEIGILMFRDICAGMAVAHTANPPVVHRDIKPANMMFAKSGAIKIMDFGLARGTSQSFELTIADSLIGTPAYMSPEQAERRNRELDARSDVFSVGIVAYELLGGRRPFVGKDREEVLAAILKREPEWLGRLNPEIPDAAARIVHRLLEKDRALRPEIAEIHGELEDLIEHLELQRRKNWLRDYYANPDEIQESLHPKRIARHLANGIALAIDPNRFEDALVELRHVLDLDAQNAGAKHEIEQMTDRQLFLARALVEAGPERFEDALRAIRRVLSVDVANPEAAQLQETLRARHRAMGLEWFHEQRLEDAERELSRAAAIEPDIETMQTIAAIHEHAAPAQAIPIPAGARGAPALAGVPGPRPPLAPQARIRNLILLAIALAAVAVVLLIVALSGGKKSTFVVAPVLTIQTEPTGASITIDDQIALRGEDGTVQAPTLTAGTFRIHVSHDGYQPEERSILLVSGATRREVFQLVPLVPVPAPDSTATLVVRTTPDKALVSIGGVPRFREEDGTIRGLTPGKLGVKVEASGFIAQTRTVTLEPGRQAEFDFVLEPAVRDTSPGLVIVDVRQFDYDTIFVDGVARATGKRSVAVELAPGSHVVRVAIPNASRSWKITLAPKDTIRLAHSFPTGCLAVTAKGTWGNVILEGRDMKARTDAVFCSLLVGTYAVQLKRSGRTFAEGTVQVDVRAGDTTVVTFSEKKK